MYYILSFLIFNRVLSLSKIEESSYFITLHLFFLYRKLIFNSKSPVYNIAFVLQLYYVSRYLCLSNETPTSLQIRVGLVDAVLQS